MRRYRHLMWYFLRFSSPISGKIFRCNHHHLPASDRRFRSPASSLAMRPPVSRPCLCSCFEVSGTCPRVGLDFHGNHHHLPAFGRRFRGPAFRPRQCALRFGGASWSRGCFAIGRGVVLAWRCSSAAVDVATGLFSSGGLPLVFLFSDFRCAANLCSFSYSATPAAVTSAVANQLRLSAVIERTGWMHPALLCCIPICNSATKPMFSHLWSA